MSLRLILNSKIPREHPGHNGRPAFFAHPLGIPRTGEGWQWKARTPPGGPAPAKATAGGGGLGTDSPAPCRRLGDIPRDPHATYQFGATGPEPEPDGSWDVALADSGDVAGYYNGWAGEVTAKYPCERPATAVIHLGYYEPSSSGNEYVAWG